MRTNELHASAKQVQRSSGRSSVSAAAYRAGVRLEDERTGLIHDYTRKQGVEHSRMYAPETAPDWAHDREALWNAVEAKENRSNSTTAHELEVAFPSEFNAMQRRECGDAVSREIMQRYNVAVDINYHQPSREGDQRNFHAHIMFTTRGFDETRSDGWARTKFRDLAHDKADKQTGDKYLDHEGKPTTRGKLEVESLRAFTADEMNRIAERDRLQVRTEHLSFERRGIDREPTQHLGPTANKIERDGRASDRGDTNRAIKAANDNRATLDKRRDVIVLEQVRRRHDVAREQREALLAQVAARHRFHGYQKEAVERAKKEHQDARTRLENISLIDRIRGRRSALERDLRDKQKSLADAQERLAQLAPEKTRQMIEQGRFKLDGRTDPVADIRSRMFAEHQKQTHQHEREQKELQQLESGLAERSNIDRVIGSITGKAREQRARIEQLRESAKEHKERKRQFDAFISQEKRDQAQVLRERQAGKHASDVAHHALINGIRSDRPAQGRPIETKTPDPKSIRDDHGNAMQQRQEKFDTIHQDQPKTAANDPTPSAPVQQNRAQQDFTQVQNTAGTGQPRQASPPSQSSPGPEPEP